MSDWKKKLTLDRAKREAMNAVWVSAGLLGASIIDRLVEKGVDKFAPSMAQYIGPIKATVTAVAGLATSMLADDGNQKQRLIGYGITSAGVISGVRLIPAVDSLFSDATNNKQTTTPAVQGVERLELLGIGESSGTVSQFNLKPVDYNEPFLPELNSDTKTADYSTIDGLSDLDEMSGEII
jgi:hypothetical protein